jgi:hypothetical protein
VNRRPPRSHIEEDGLANEAALAAHVLKTMDASWVRVGAKACISGIAFEIIEVGDRVTLKDTFGRKSTFPLWEILESFTPV